VLRFLTAGLVAAAWLWPSVGGAQRVRGTIEDASGAGLASVAVEFRGPAAQRLPVVVTDNLGRFWLALPVAGTWTVTATRIGFRSMGPAAVDVAAGEEVSLVIRMDVAPIPLAALEVRGRRRLPVGAEAVYRRIEDMRQRGIGLSATREELERMSRHSVGSVLTTLSTRLRIIDTPQMNVNTVLLRDGMQRGGYCAPAVFIDGQRANPRPTNVNLLIEPNAIEAIELYMGAAQVPIGFQDPAGCGSVLIWSRGGSASEGKPSSLRRVLLAGGLLVGLLLFLR
jgi:hypothetical protein